MPPRGLHARGWEERNTGGGGKIGYEEQDLRDSFSSTLNDRTDMSQVESVSLFIKKGEFPGRWA